MNKLAAVILFWSGPAFALPCADLTGTFIRKGSGAQATIAQATCDQISVVYKSRNQTDSEAWTPNGTCRSYYIVGGDGSNSGPCATLRWTSGVLSGDVYGFSSDPSPEAHLTISINAQKNLELDWTPTDHNQPGASQVDEWVRK